MKTNRTARNIYSGLILLGCGILAASCITEETDGGYPDGKDGQAEVQFSLRMPGASRATRAMDAADEEAVVTADVLVFDAAGALVDIGHGRSITDVSTATEAVTSFNVTLQIGANRDVWVVTNAREIIDTAYPAGLPVDGTVDKDALRASLTMNLPSAGWNAATGSYTPIPMWGEKLAVDIDGTTQLTGSNSVKVNRMVARVGVYLDAGITSSDFTLTSVRVYNYNTAGRLVPDALAADWSASAPYAVEPSLPANPGATTGPLEYLSMTTVDRELDGEIYLFEAEKGTAIGDPAGDYMDNPCLVGGGTLRRFDGGDVLPYRFRPEKCRRHERVPPHPPQLQLQS